MRYDNVLTFLPMNVDPHGPTIDPLKVSTALAGTVDVNVLENDGVSSDSTPLPRRGPIVSLDCCVSNRPDAAIVSGVPSSIWSAASNRTMAGVLGLGASRP